MSRRVPVTISVNLDSPVSKWIFSHPPGQRSAAIMEALNRVIIGDTLADRLARIEEMLRHGVVMVAKDQDSSSGADHDDDVIRAALGGLGL